MSRRRPTAIPPSTPCLRCRRMESTISALTLSVVHFSLSGFQKCWCGTIAAMFSQAPRRDSQDLCCFFPSWLYLLDGEDNCMLSVPFSTSDLHFSCWQSGENCQVVAAGAFTLPGYAIFFFKTAVPLILSVLLSCPSVVCSMFPVFQA